MTEYYLRKELYDLVKEDDSIFDFLQAGSLDGIWYWDLETPENEWMSPAFWKLFGYEPDEKKHLASEWKDMINADDLKEVLKNFNAHCADPNHLFDQIVRYTHKDGHTIWVRCRGTAIRDDDGNPIRMLGAHTDVTELKQAQEKTLSLSLELSDLKNFLQDTKKKIKIREV
jgi:PAS domain S-box-containing protein